MTLPVVSVIVPCHGYAGVLEGCVESVLAQEGVAVRVLIVDDCSPDDTPAVSQRLVARDERVAYRRHERNRGLIATANHGLEWADGDYIVLLSADDLLTPGALRRAVTVMELEPHVGMVYGRPLLAHAGRPLPQPRGRWRGTDVWSGREWIERRCRTGHNCISSPEVVVRASVHRAAGTYDPACTHASDLNLWLRIAAVSDIAYIRGVPQAIYRIHPGSMLRNQGGPLVDLSERRAAFDSFFARSAGELDDADRLRGMAGRALARQALWRASRALDRGLAAELPVEELVAFAFSVYPAAAELREWRGLQMRRALRGRSRWFVPFLLTGAAHRAALHGGRLRWRLRGV